MAQWSHSMMTLFCTNLHWLHFQIKKKNEKQKNLQISLLESLDSAQYLALHLMSFRGVSNDKTGARYPHDTSEINGSTLPFYSLRSCCFCTTRKRASDASSCPCSPHPRRLHVKQNPQASVFFEYKQGGVCQNSPRSGAGKYLSSKSDLVLPRETWVRTERMHTVRKRA